MDKSGLDEMQRERHSRIGSQMFVAMSFALLINIMLYGAGIRWLEPPSDTMAIMVACFGVYVVRLVVAGAFQHPRIKKGKYTALALMITAVLSAVSVIALQKLPMNAASSSDSFSAYILAGVSFIGLLAMGVAAIIKKKRDIHDEDE